MSFTEDVTELVQKRGRATVHDLAPHFPGHTHRQISRALQNGVTTGRLAVEGHDSLGGRPQGGACRLSVFIPAKQDLEEEPLEQRKEPRNGWQYGAVASVWDYGQGLSR